MIIMILASFLSVAQTDPAKTVWIAAGVATTDITPDHPVALTGYGDRSGVFDSVVQRLKAKALFIGKNAETSVVIITMDLIGFPASLADDLVLRLAKKTGLRRDQIALTATHTHCGPETGPLVNISGRTLQGKQLYDVKNYRDVLENKLEQLVLDAMNNREPCLLQWGKGTANFSKNRRVLENGKWVGFGTSNGPVEHDLPVLQVSNEKGEVKGILLNYACHGTTLTPKHNFIHGDWMGQAQQLLEERFPGAVAMVAVGCGADSNPDPRGELINVEQHGKAIADEVQRLIQSKKLVAIRSLPSRSFEKLKLEYEQIPTKETLLGESTNNDVTGLLARNYLELLARGEKIPVDYDYPIQVWNFGNDLTMVFLGGEVVVDYVKRLKQDLGADKLWVNAYSNDVSCYIASKKLYQEGGYEVDGSMAYYNKPSRFKEDTEEAIVKSIKKQVLQTQRTVKK